MDVACHGGEPRRHAQSLFGPSRPLKSLGWGRPSTAVWILFLAHHPLHAPLSRSVFGASADLLPSPPLPLVPPLPAGPCRRRHATATDQANGPSGNSAPVTFKRTSLTLSLTINSRVLRRAHSVSRGERTHPLILLDSKSETPEPFFPVGRVQIAGGAYTMHTPAAATVRSSIRRLREIAEA